MNLKEIQEGIQAFILNNKEEVCTAIIKPANMRVQERLQVYSNAYFIRLIEALEDDFKVLKKFIGQEAFHAMAREYLVSLPSSHFSVHTVGNKLASFLKSSGADPALCELAEFEWRLTETMYAKDAPVLKIENLANISQDQWITMQLVLHPSVSVMVCHYNSPTFWQLAQEMVSAPKLEKLSSPQKTLIWRQDYEVYFRSLSEEQAHLIDSLERVDTFANLCEAMFHYLNEQEAITWVAAILQEWISQGILSEIITDEE